MVNKKKTPKLKKKRFLHIPYLHPKSSKGISYDLLPAAIVIIGTKYAIVPQKSSSHLNNLTVVSCETMQSCY